METEKYLRYSIGFTYILFGALKLLGEETLNELIAETVFLLPLTTAIPLLGLFEVIIGICFFYEPLKEKGLYLIIPHLAGTFLPIIMAPERLFQRGLTLEAHYIIKNLIILAAALQVQEDEFLEELSEKIGNIF